MEADWDISGKETMETIQVSPLLIEFREEILIMVNLTF